MNSNILCIIPARSGSKGIPHKNIRAFLGHPLMAYSIVAGLRATCMPRVIVSTDDKNYANIAQFYGAEVPFLRPKKHAQDDSLDICVFSHALEWLYAEEGYVPEMVVHLRPTTPFRSPDLVQRAITLYDALAPQYPYPISLRGVVPATPPPEKIYEDAQPFLQPVLGTINTYESYNRPRQFLRSYWFHNGVIDITSPYIIAEGRMSGEHIYPMHLNPEYSIDLDTEEDWEYAEWKIDRTDLPRVKP